MQSGSARTPLIIAGVAAALTYVVIGQHGPIGFLKSIGLMHGDHTASAKVTVNTDDEDAAEQAREKAEEKADRERERAERERDRAEREREKAEQKLASISASPALPALPAIPAAPAAPPAPGNSVSETRNLAAFDHIVISDNADATIQIGDTYTVNVTAADGEAVHTDVHDGKLSVSGHNASAHIVVTMPHLLGLEVNGATKVKLSGLKDSIKIAAHGPVQLTADGTVDSADLTMDGPSKLALKDMKTKDMRITLNGMGDAEVFATDTLTAEVHGVGHVRYLGDPHTQSTIHGMGSVEKLQS